MRKGSTVHIVPSVGGNWQVVDLDRKVKTFPSRKGAVAHATAVAEARQPSQVVLFDKEGRFVPVKKFQIPEYYRKAASARQESIEAAVKLTVIDNLIAVGASVLQDTIDSIKKQLELANAKALSGTADHPTLARSNR